jgi:chaperone modulatory protein CbpM
MIMESREFALQARIDAKLLSQWIAAGWLMPHRTEAAQVFSEVDLARAHLVRDLQELGVNDEGIPIILDLIDQLHGVRRLLSGILAGFDTRPEAARRRVVAGLQETMPGSSSQPRDHHESESC